MTSVSFSPDGQWIASGSGSEYSANDNTVKVWSVESGECVTTLEGHLSRVRSVSFSPDGASIASGLRVAEHNDQFFIRIWHSGNL